MGAKILMLPSALSVSLLAADQLTASATLMLPPVVEAVAPTLAPTAGVLVVIA